MLVKGGILPKHYPRNDRWMGRVDLYKTVKIGYHNRTPMVLLGVMFVTGCNTDEKDYFPLTRGLTLDYSVTRTTSDGTTEQRYSVTNLAPMTIAGEQVVPRKTTMGSILYLYTHTARYRSRRHP